MPRSLLDLDDLTAQEIDALLARATQFAVTPPPRDLLRDVCVVNLFFEASTRTYTSFALAEQRVGADVVALPPGASSLGKGETIADTALTLGAMGVRVIVTRHPESGFPYRLAESFDGHVINAGDGRHAHPTQALLDLLTLQKEFGTIAGLRVALVGDILHSRVARSNVLGLRALDAEVTLVGPQTLLPAAMARDGVRVARDLDDVLKESDAVMLLRIQHERIASGVLPSLDDYARNYRLDARRLALLKPTAIVMHPGPYARGVELTEDVFAYPGWRYKQQVSHGVFVRMAVLDFLVNAPAAREVLA
ncbi:MAG: aspartate carbamoyltransferase catalytic subunit [Candidatus Eremiobacteraeota bacterium]|nr:aspartate carbamoyltransferase catalytic subunit [Candidatus Eremiobacteraeota bacterium]